MNTWDDDDDDGTYNPWPEVDSQIEVSQLFCCLNSFERHIMFLSYVGYSVRHIAAICGLPKSTLHDKMRDARIKMLNASDT